jgi:hypothetical protein
LRLYQKDDARITNWLDIADYLWMERQKERFKKAGKNTRIIEKNYAPAGGSTKPWTNMRQIALYYEDGYYKTVDKPVNGNSLVWVDFKPGEIDAV